MFPYEDSKTVSVCSSVRTPRKEITLASSIPVLLVIDASMERFSQVLRHGNPKFDFFFFKFEIRILTCDEEPKSP